MFKILLHRTEHVLFGVHLNNHSQTPIWKQTGGALPLCTPCTPAYLPKTGAEPGRAGGTAIGASHLDSSSYYYITISLYHYITTSLHHYITISLYTLHTILFCKRYAEYAEYAETQKSSTEPRFHGASASASSAHPAHLDISIERAKSSAKYHLNLNVLHLHLNALHLHLNALHLHLNVLVRSVR